MQTRTNKQQIRYSTNRAGRELCWCAFSCPKEGRAGGRAGGRNVGWMLVGKKVQAGRRIHQCDMYPSLGAEWASKPIKRDLQLAHPTRLGAPQQPAGASWTRFSGRPGRPGPAKPPVACSLQQDGWLHHPNDGTHTHDHFWNNLAIRLVFPLSLFLKQTAALD